MEQSVPTQSNRAYGWALLAAAATVLLIAVTYLNIPPAAGPEEDAALIGASYTLFGFFLRCLLFVPLLCVTPALWARSAWRVHPAMLAALSAVAFATGAAFGGMMDGLYNVGLIAPAGVLLYVAQRQKVSHFRIVFYGSLVLLLGLFLRISVPTMVSDGDAFLPMRAIVDAYRAIWLPGGEEPFDTTTVAGSVLALMDEMLRELKLNANQYMIEILYYPAALAALCAALLSHAFNRKGGAAIRPLPPFADWMAEPGYVFGVLALSLAALVLSMAGQEAGTALLRIAYVLWLLPMALVGLCTLKNWSKGRPWIFAIGIVALCTMFSMAVQVLSIVGMIGFMRAEMRKRMQGGTQ